MKFGGPEALRFVFATFRVLAAESLHLTSCFFDVFRIKALPLALGRRGLLLLLIRFVPTSVSPAHRSLTPVQTGLQLAAPPVVFNAMWDCAELSFLLRKSAVTNFI